MGPRRRAPVTVLVLDNDAPMSRALRRSLAAQGYVIIEARSVEGALRKIVERPVDLLILDAEAEGVQVCRRLRSAAPQAGVVVVTSCGAEEVKLRMLEVGADDCFTKPVSFPLLLARLHALSRRIETVRSYQSAVLRADSLELDLGNHTLRRSGVRICLSPTEFSVLSYLMQNAGLLVEREKLSAAIWGPAHGSEFEYVRTYVKRLRRKIEDNTQDPKYLLTVPGVGYRFCRRLQPATLPVAATTRDRQPDVSLTPESSAKDGVGMIAQLSLRRLRKVVQIGGISFPSQVPVFPRESRADIQWRLVTLYFVQNWSCSALGKRYGITMERVRQMLSSWVRRAALLGYLQEIPPATACEGAPGKT
jgi:two-component system, OmpR family, KDP operon response regulator KdpE